MRVLLDECIPKRLRSELSEHFVRTVVESGWAGLKNGRLLQQAATEFDCFLTVDRNLQFQQHTGSLPIAVIVIAAANNKFETLRPALEAVRTALATIKTGQLVVVRSEGLSERTS